MRFSGLWRYLGQIELFVILYHRDRVNKYIAELEYQNENLTYQVDLAEKAKLDASRKYVCYIIF
jgi:hypothetical protein